MFTHDLADYERNFDMVGLYQEQMAFALSRMVDIPLEQAREYIKEKIVEKTDFDAIKIKFTARQKNGDRVIKEVPILEYVQRIFDGKLGMSPTMTTYLRPDQKLSLIVQSVADGMAERKIVKREGQIAKQKGDSVQAIIKNGRQNAIKRLINSWSGASLDKHNTFNCQSTHPTLTTMCRISTALATASVEKFLAGMRYYHTPEKVIEDILAVCTSIDNNKVWEAIKKYNLHIPTVEEVMAIIRRSTNYYWWDADQDEFILKLVKTLKPSELAALAYDGDFYHLFVYNYDFCHKMLTRLSTTVDLEQPQETRLKELNGDIATLVSNLIGTEIAGSAIWDYLDESKHPKGNDIELLADRVLNNLLNGFEGYRLLIETFCRVNHFPINVGAQNHSVRLTVPLGDTDSTIFSTKHINALYFGEAKFDAEQEPVADVMVHMVNGIIAHALANFTAQLGVVPENRHLLIMKNEFKFPALQLTPVAKTYHAYVKAQEGLVFKKPEFELKGARNHGGRTNQDIMTELHNFMETSLTNLNKGIKINRGELVDIVHRIESDIEASLHRKDNVYFETVRIKTIGEYKNPNVGTYVQLGLWNKLFGSKYDMAPDPTYQAFKVPLDFSRISLNDWLETLPNGKREYEAWRLLHDKKANVIPTFIAVPKDNFAKFGLPKEIIPVVDHRKIISFTCDCHYLNLQSMCINLDYPNNERVLTDMI